MTTGNASRMRGDVLLVGSMPFDDAETVFRETAKGLKSHLGCMPDGEVKERKNWVGMLPEFIFADHPQLEETVSPGGPLEQPDLPEGVHLSELDPFWAFKIKPGEKLHFDNLLYGDFAIQSYGIFKRLRDEGVIEPGTRFQVCLPSAHSGIDAFFNDTSEWETVYAAYWDGIQHEIQRILEVVPAEDLVIQFDMAWEVVDLAMDTANYFSFWPRSDLEGKLQRHMSQLDSMWRAVPDETLLGYHWCYGTWGGWPMTAMQDLGLCVRLSNEAVKRTGRRLDYMHMPVVKNPGAGFFDPLDDLDVGDTKIYLGIVHENEDGLGAFRSRLQEARKHLPSFGIGGVCGYGRIDPSELQGVLATHTACAEELSKA
jgi:hypothetical protein